MVCPDPESAAVHVQLSQRAYGDATHGAAACGNPEMPAAPTQVSGWAFPFYLRLPTHGIFVFSFWCCSCESVIRCELFALIAVALRQPSLVLRRTCDLRRWSEPAAPRIACSKPGIKK